MTYRNLTSEQFNKVKDLASHRCTKLGLKTIGEYKRVGNEIIDEIEAGKLKFIFDCQNNIVIVEN